jgi:D-apionolactonase
MEWYHTGLRTDQVMPSDTWEPDRTITLSAGQISLTLDHGDLRFIRYGPYEVARRIFAALRDRNWGTPVSKISNPRLRRAQNSFQITWHCQVKRDEIDFEWDARIEGSAAGTITFRIDGIANSAFLRNRIGLNLLHPADTCAGMRCRTQRADGSWTETGFPEEIAAQEVLPGFQEIRGMVYEVSPGILAKWEFEGDLFETEDQRNWTDATFKTFSTPLSLPFPVQLNPGDRVSQLIRLTIDGGAPPGPRSLSRPVSISLSAAPPLRLPPIGLGMASHGQRLSARETGLLKRLNLAHLSVEPGLVPGGWVEALDIARESATELGVQVVISAHISSATDLDALVRAAEPLKRDSVDCAFFPDTWAAAVRAHFPHWRIGSGSPADFYFLNQRPPSAETLDFLTFAIHPQEHTTDTLSMVETLPIQGEAVRQARRISGGRPVYVLPVTLKPRFCAAATGPPLPATQGELPPEVDHRQASLFAAAWTAISLKQLSEAGAARITYFETTGWRGVLDTEVGSPAPFPKRAGTVFPLYYVFALIAPFRRGHLIPCVSTDPLLADALLLEADGRKRLVLANLTGDEREVELALDLPNAKVRVLDESSLATAVLDPDLFLAQQTPETSRRVYLPPYTVASIDADLRAVLS